MSDQNHKEKDQVKVVNPDVIEVESLKKDEDKVTASEDLKLPINLDSPGNLPSSDLGRAQDPLSAYMKEISRYELLSQEEEKELVKSLEESGDIDVAKKLVVHNLRLVVKIAMEYRRAYQNVMDLIQEGNIGLMKAVSKYDSSKGAKLSYYASWWIRSYILKFILDNFRLVKIGTTNEQKKLFYNLLKEKERLVQMGIEPTQKVLSENLGVSEKAVVTMEKRLSPTSGDVSIDTPLRPHDSNSTLGDMLKDSSIGPEDEVEHMQSLEILEDNLNDFVKELPDRDKFIFKERLLSEAPLSLQAIADKYGVSRERIRQVELKIMKNLKLYMSKYLR
ncbi:MAG: RNA polymerase factor sigma-32 [Bacteriovoracaceae bacterium]